MKSKFKITPAQILAIGFLLLILVGTALLSLPFASNDGQVRFIDALFTATSATCVTGLVTLNTATQWTLFGKIVIIVMIQIGGLGFMTFISLTGIIAKKRFSLHERKIMMQSTGSLELSGLTKLVRRIAIGTFIVEGIGALILAIKLWTSNYSFAKGLWYGIFHSVSAFCNAGFDIFGTSSLEAFNGDYVVLITLALLVIIGGIGFIVWEDIASNGFHFKKYKLHSKLVLLTTFVLLAGGTVIFFFTEKNHAFSELSTGEKWLNAFFQSTTLRTAGFASVNQASLSNSGFVSSVVLMLIGGSPGSTAGGIKTITVTVLVLNALCFSKNQSSLVTFKKRIHDDLVKQASAIASIYLTLAVTVTCIICAIESNAQIPLRSIAFEVASAVATVGLTEGITPLLSVASKALLCFTMYFGRLGGLTLLLAIAEKKTGCTLEKPCEKILIG